jgi:hypothetical protein
MGENSTQTGPAFDLLPPEFRKFVEAEIERMRHQQQLIRAMEENLGKFPDIINTSELHMSDVLSSDAVEGATIRTPPVMNNDISPP